MEVTIAPPNATLGMTLQNLTVGVRESVERERTREKEREGEGEGETGAPTGIFLNELVDVDPAACAAGVKHDTVENPAGVDGRAPFMLMVRARGERHFGSHRVSFCGVDGFGCRVDRLGDHGVRRRAGL